MDIQPHVTAIVIGGGNRGTNYASYAVDYPEKLTVIAVAEPKFIRRERIKRWCNIKEEYVFEDWQKLASKGKIADFAIIATPDRLHKDPAICFAKLGYHLLLEKPMAVNRRDCEEIETVCKDSGVFLAVCHVLRYLPPVISIKESIMRGDVGNIVNIQHTEKVGYWHFAHSFVRGNWKNSEESSPSLLSKCGHDIDLINYWMGDKKCKEISSFGSLYHFKKENKPKMAGDVCLSCVVETSCPYSAKKIYLDTLKDNNDIHWPHSVVCDSDICSDKKEYRLHLTKALQNGPYGKCVYSCENNVCDNQTVQILYEDGSIATLTMIAFTEEVCQRYTKIYGTRGQLTWNGESNGPVYFFNFLTQETKQLEISTKATSKNLEGHGGADFYLMDSFVKAVAFHDQSLISTGTDDSLESHLLVFAAEESRVRGQNIAYDAFLNNDLPD